MHICTEASDSTILFDIVRVINHLYVCMYVCMKRKKTSVDRHSCHYKVFWLAKKSAPNYYYY